MYFLHPKYFPDAVVTIILYNYKSLNIKSIRIEPQPILTMKMNKDSFICVKKEIV
jgi:hypothetical protein